MGSRASGAVGESLLDPRPFPVLFCCKHYNLVRLPFHGSLTRWNNDHLLRNRPNSLVVQTVKRLSTVRETQVQSLGGEDPLEKEMATHSSTIAWKIPWTEEPGGLQSMGFTGHAE